MNYRKARRLASTMLAAEARRLADETRRTGHAARDRDRLERAFTEIADEMDRRAGTPRGPEPDSDQFALFDPPRKEPA
jgi:hypothetical protein